MITIGIMNYFCKLLLSLSMNRLIICFRIKYKVVVDILVKGKSITSDLIYIY